MSSNYVELEMQYLLECLVIAKKSRKKHHLLQPRGAILVNEGHILASGFDNPKTQEYAELMAISKTHKNMEGAKLYLSMFFSCVWEDVHMEKLINSKIARIIYGYNNPRLIENTDYKKNSNCSAKIV